MRRTRQPIPWFLLAAAACSPREPLRLGLVSSLAGRHSGLGISSRDGAALAVADVNAAGGSHGRPLALVIRDDGQDAEQARRALE